MDKLDTIKVIVATAVQSFASGFKGRHEGEVDGVDYGKEDVVWTA